MYYDYVHLDNLSDVSAYRNHNVQQWKNANQLQSRGVSPCIVTQLQALLTSLAMIDNRERRPPTKQDTII